MTRHAKGITTTTHWADPASKPAQTTPWLAEQAKRDDDEASSAGVLVASG